MTSIAWNNAFPVSKALYALRSDKIQINIHDPLDCDFMVDVISSISEATAVSPLFLAVLLCVAVLI